MSFRALLAFLSILSQGAAPATEILNIRLALASNNLAGLQQKLVSVSTPASSEFRQWLSKDEVTSYVQPSAETVAAFNSWASANSITPGATSPHGDWVSISVPVSKANTLFAKFEVFTHPDIKSNLVRTLSVSLPSELVGHVDVIHPSTDFVHTSPLASIQTRKGRPPPTKSCDTSVGSGRITPACLQDLYGIPSTPATQRNNSLLVTGFSNLFAETADLSITGKPAGRGDGGVEANLDIQYHWFLSAGVQNTTFEDFVQDALDTVTFLEGAEDPPTVVSMSDPEKTTLAGRLQRHKICGALQGLTARGVSVLAASGDFLHALPRLFELSGTFNNTGRAIPDVAMHGIIALINDHLIAAGKPVLGFLNPFLYASQSAFTDITAGHTRPVCPASTAAFDATTGWDPLSGLLAAAFKA
ncbi:subtilisin-like protein [Mycena latifolia]|nr:subtilisin-like protein [Mycena latifolia]